MGTIEVNFVCVVCYSRLLLKQKVFVHVVDMAKPKEILKFCQEFTDSNSPLDILVKCSATVW